VKEIDFKIKKKIIETDTKFANQSLFLFTKNVVLNRCIIYLFIETSFNDLYPKHQNK
jgi:hypothetical protein